VIGARACDVRAADLTLRREHGFAGIVRLA